MQWLMLQQDEPDDYVIATGVQHSVREFVDAAARELGMVLRWDGAGVDQNGIVKSIDHSVAKTQSAVIKSESPSVNEGDVIVSIDPRYFRPTEVDALLGDPTKAKQKLGWVPKVSFDQLIAEMVAEDLKKAEKDALTRYYGYQTPDHHE